MKINTGLIGCGRISNMHLNSIQELENFNLVAVCDIDEKRAKEAAEKYDCKYFLDYRKMLEKCKLDLVAIATPNGLHYEMGMEVLKNKMHLLMEKPVAINKQEAKKLIDFAEESNLHFFAVKQVRFNPAVQLLKSLIEQGKLGRIFSSGLIVRWTRPDEYFINSKWRGSLKMDGGTLLNQGIHYIDIMQWILGDVESITAYVDTINHNIEVEDEAFALLKFKNNIYANIEFTINTYPHNLECSLTILGEKGSIKIGGSAMNKIETWHVKDFPKPNIQEGFSPNVYAGGLYQGSCPNHIFVYEDILKTFYNKHHNFLLHHRLLI